MANNAHTQLSCTHVHERARTHTHTHIGSLIKAPKILCSCFLGETGKSQGKSIC